MIDMPYIESVLRRFESRQLVAYIPCSKRNFTGTNDFAACGDVLGASGVTVGTGLDLGQQSLSGLQRMGIPAHILDRLRPYIGLKKSAAVQALAAHPLTLTDSDVDAIDACVHREYVARIERLYDRERTGPLTFADCPKQAQAVMTSVYYQLGAYNGGPGYRVLWGHFVRQDWCSSATELMTGFSRYASRRRAEGAILKEVC